jgi:hypothetical protein
MAGAVLVLAALVVLIPRSPLYLPKLLVPPILYEGRTPRAWMQDLKNPDAEVRHHAIHALGDLGADAADSIPMLATILVEDADRQSRGEAALALWKMAPVSRTAVPALTRALEDKEPIVRMDAVLALFKLGSESRPAVAALIKVLGDDDNETNVRAFSFTIRNIAARALGRASAGTDEAVPALMTALEGAQTESMKKDVAQALGDVGPPARPAVPLLRKLLKDNSQEVRRIVQEALLHIEAGSDASQEAARANDDPPDPQLPDAERAYLWDIEHHGNVLVKHGFGPLAAALQKADPEALSRLMADDFAGTDLVEPRCVRVAKEFAEVERLQDAGHAPGNLRRDAFVDRLLQFRKTFGARPPQVKLALMSLGPQQRGQLEGAWEGTAQLRMYGEQQPGAPAEVVVLLRYEVPRPTETTLSAPGWLHSAGVLQVLTARAPRYLFAEVAHQRGLDTQSLHDNWTASRFEPTPGGVYVCDFDRDGILDVLITDVSGNTLYHGRPDGTFEDVTQRYGLPRQSRGSTVAAWVDLDGDGWEDLILDERIYRNEGGQRFTDYTARCNLRLPIGTTGMVVADYDRDGKLDLYATRPGRPGSKSWLEGRSGESEGNHLFRNKGNWQFEDVTRVSRTLGGHRSTFTAAWLDANNDGWPDLHVLNEFGDGVLLVNNHDGTFSEQALAERPADFGSMGLAVGDVNNDGNIDIFCANMYSKAGSRVIGNLAADAYPPAVLEKIRRFVAGSQLHLNRGGLRFDQVGSPMHVAGIGWSYGACLADLDNDGWLDLYATCGFVSKSRDEPDG